MGIDTQTNYGESYPKILRYFYPEFITALLLYSLPLLIDAYFIGNLKSTPSYAVHGASQIFLHWIIKFAEAFLVGTLILTGQFNGQQKFKQAGKVLQNSLWLMIVVGTLITCILYFGAYWIYWWYGLSDELIYVGVPFMQLRAIGIFFMFVAFSFIGFLRGIKNTRVPMYIFVIGSIAFVFFDYLLVFGKCGFPEMGLYGSAVAYIIQYVVMSIVAIAYMVYMPEIFIYQIDLMPDFSKKKIQNLLKLSWPIMIDKSIIALSYIWLFQRTALMGTSALAGAKMLRDMMQLGFLPAVAFAQIITLLVSNDFGAKLWNNIRANLYKVFMLALLMVSVLLIVFSLYPTCIIELFDRNGDFTELAARAFPLLSVLVFFDVLQLILAGTLRGAKDVRIVMLTRIVVFTVYFVPVSYMISKYVHTTPLMKLVLLYASFFIGSLFMSLMYIYRFHNGKWKNN